MKKLSGKFSVTSALVAGILVAIANPAAAAYLDNGFGSSCDGDGVWHFVNNQTGGAGAGYLTAVFDTGSIGPVTPSKVLAHTQHFNVITTGPVVLENAFTNLPGRLVLSDFTCDVKKDECDPKVEKCDVTCDPKVEKCY